MQTGVTQELEGTDRRVLSSVTNALHVLEYLVEAREAGVSEVGRAIGVTVGSSHRLLSTLVAAGFVEQNPANRRYRPSQKLVWLAERLRHEISTRDIAHQRLVELMHTVHETVNLAVLSDDQVLYVDKVTSDQPFGIEARIGSRLPAYCTALGKVLMAFADGEDQARYLAMLRKRSARSLEPTPPNANSFREELAQVREQGFAVDLGEFLPDVFCVAAPVSGSAPKAIGAMSISVPRSRFEKHRANLSEHVRAAAEELSGTLQELGLGESTAELGLPVLAD